MLTFETLDDLQVTSSLYCTVLRLLFDEPNDKI